MAEQINRLAGRAEKFSAEAKECQVNRTAAEASRAAAQVEIEELEAQLAQQDRAAHVETLEEDGALVRDAVVVGVFEDDDAVPRNLRFEI